MRFQVGPLRELSVTKVTLVNGFAKVYLLLVDRQICSIREFLPAHRFGLIATLLALVLG